MRTFIPLFISFLVVFSCSSHPDSFESDHITEMFPGIYLSVETHLYVDNRGNPVTGDFETHHENDVLHAELSFEDGIIVSGSVWDPEETLRSVYSLEDGLPTVTTLYENGQPMVRFQHKDGMRDIIAMKSWYEDGTPQHESTKEFYKSWHENGQLALKVPMTEGRMHGVGYEWYENGELAAENHFKDDQWHGSSRSWDEDGNLRSEKFYVMGMPDGVHKVWDSHGSLIEEKMYENGKPHGAHKTWDSDGNLIEERLFEDGAVVTSL